MQLFRELQPTKLLPNVAIGLIAGAIAISFELSFAALIFAGRLAEHLSVGVGLVLFSVAITGILITLCSSCPQIVVGSATAETAILAWSAGAISRNLSTSATSNEILATVIALLALTSLLTGIVLLLLGLFRVGDLVRTLPYPVVGGFVASSGWLLVKGAFEVMVDHPLTWDGLSLLLQTDVLMQWVPGLLFALYLLYLSRHRTHPLVMPATLVAGVALFYFLLSLTGISVAEASAQGWTLRVTEAQGSWQPFSWAVLSQVRWSAIAQQKMCIATVVFLAAISLPLKAGGLELLMQQDVDSNRELKAAGIANLVVGCAGGSLSYHALSDTVMMHKLGGTSRLANWTGISVFIAIAILGNSLLSYFPKPILAGLLLFLGLSLLLDWLYDAWFELPRADYLVVQLTLIVSATVGFLQGLAVGWGLAMLLFVVHYSRLYAVQPGISGMDYNSNVERSPLEQQILQQQGDRLYILKLQGLIFFGTANQLVERVRQRLTATQQPPVQFILLDFAQVNDLDISAVQSFARLQQLMHRYEKTLVLTQLSSTVQARLQGTGCSNSASVRIFHNLDQGVQWCEDHILQAEVQSPSGTLSDSSSDIRSDIF